MKEEFERQFLLEFRYENIGTETLQRFRYNLQRVLTTNYVKYKHMYDTQVQAQEFLWWFNKDLTVTNSRELNLNEVNTGTNDYKSNSKGESSSLNKSSSNDETNGTNKFSDTPQGDINNIDSYLTNASTDISNSNSNSNDENNTTSKDESINNSNFENLKNGIQTETYKSIEQGNIGTTSSADLIKGWLRDGLIEVNKEIFKDCQNLFMLVY